MFSFLDWEMAAYFIDDNAISFYGLFSTDWISHDFVITDYLDAMKRSCLLINTAVAIFRDELALSDHF